MFKKVLLKTVLHVFLLKSKLLFLVSKNSELKAKFLFKNKATKSNKNVPSLGSNVVGVVLGGNVAVGVSWVEVLLSGSIRMLMSLLLVLLPWVVML